MKKLTNVTKVEFKVIANVVGVVNKNGPDKVSSFNNHTGAKKDKTGRDYTSSACIRHDMWRDIMPNQPTVADLKSRILPLAASVYGHMRGYLEVDTGAKKDSSVHVSDAWTTDETFQKPIFDQGVSSKPKETNLKNKKGEDASDPSMFSVDNYGPRKQGFDVKISIKNTQRSVLEGQGGAIAKKDVPAYVESMSNSLQDAGAPGELKIVKSVEAGAILAAPVDSVIFSDEQVTAMIKGVTQRVANLSIDRTRASFNVDRNAMKVLVHTAGEMSPTELTLNEWSEAMNSGSVEYKQFYKAA